MANVTRKTRADKGVPRVTTLSGWIGVFLNQSDEARRVWMGVMSALDQELRDGTIAVTNKRVPVPEDEPETEATEANGDAPQ